MLDRAQKHRFSYPVRIKITIKTNELCVNQVDFKSSRKKRITNLRAGFVLVNR